MEIINQEHGGEIPIFEIEEHEGPIILGNYETSRKVGKLCIEVQAEQEGPEILEKVCLRLSKTTNVSDLELRNTSTTVSAEGRDERYYRPDIKRQDSYAKIISLRPKGIPQIAIETAWFLRKDREYELEEAA